jgi:twitching motility protein PilT
MENTSNYPVSLNDLLKAGVDMKASDLHLMVGHPPSLRISGDITRLNLPVLTDIDITHLTYSIINNEQITRFEKEWELDFSHTITDLSRFRGNMMMQKGTIAAVYRIVPFNIPPLDSLGLPSCTKELCNLSRGLILVTGPTGMGKSTTMAAMIDYINSTRALNIVTVEDPIEFIHKNKNAYIRQREIGFDTHSFRDALNHVLRHDPDIILIGEMRDLESISIALTAAETGHLVISTLHTQTAPLSVNRIVDVFPLENREQVRKQLANSLRAIISQQLVPMAQEKRKILATEVLLDSPATKNLIREGKEHQLYTVIQTNKNLGMHTMDSSLFRLYSEGKITKETAFEYCIDYSEMERMMK